VKVPEILIATLESAFNRLLSLDPEAAAQLTELEGHIICLQLDGLNIQLYIFPSRDDVMILDDFDGEADTTIQGTPIALVKLGLATDKQSEMFEGDVKITGNLKLGRKFNRLFASLDIDWEEQLSKVVGDMAAHTIGNISRTLFSWHQRNEKSMRMNASEYLQEEIHYLPSQNQTDSFYDDVNRLRNDVARMEARLNKLEEKQNNNLTDSKDSL